MKYAPLSDLLRQASIKTDYKFMDWSNSSFKDFPETSRITGAYIIFYQVEPIYHDTHVIEPVAQSSEESE